MFKILLPTSLLLGLLAGSLSCQAAISDAEAVNRAGMQRMLSQRIAKNYLMIGTDTRVDLAASQLDSSIASLEENAQLLGDYAPSDGIRKALEEATQTWHQYRQLALSRPDREQSAELLRLAERFLAAFVKNYGRPARGFSDAAVAALKAYRWPGNVRELENAIERAAILSESPEIDAELLGIDIELDELDDEFEEDSLGGIRGIAGGNEPTEDLSLEDYFQHFVLEHQDHMTETELARKLGISRKCLWERRQRLGIPRRKSSSAAG